MPAPRVSIRLGTDGKAQVQSDFADIQTAGDAASKRIAASFERDSASAEAALEKLNKTAQRLSSVSQTPIQQTIGQSTSTGFGDPGGTARASAMAMQQQFAASEQAAQRLLASIDPLYGAQLRYDQALAQATQLQAQGVLSTGQLTQIQAGLKTQLDGATVSMGGFRSASGGARIAQMELMGAARGFTDAIAIGMPIQRAASIEMGRITEAAAQMGGSLGKVGEFLASGWGIALVLASVAIVPFVSKLIEASSALDTATGKLKKEAEQQEINDQAHKAFAVTLEGVEQGIRNLTKAYEEYENRLKSTAQKELEDAQAKVLLLENTRKQTQATLDQAKAQLALNNALAIGPETKGRADPRLIAADQARQQIEEAQAALDKSAADLDNARESVIRFQSAVTTEQSGKSAVDAINRDFDHQIEKTRTLAVQQAARARAAGDEAKAQALVTTQLQKQVDALNARRAADIKAAEERDKKPGANAAGTMAFDAQIGAFFDIASKYRGMSETSDKSVLESFFRAANENLDPEKTAWCAAFVNAVLAAGGVHGTGSLAASSFLDFGKDDVHSPQRGDVVVIRSNGSASGMHVGFLDSVDNKTGAFTLLAGNTGNKVGSQTVPASSVLAVRRPETPSEAFTADAKADEARVKALDDLLSKQVEVNIFSKEELAIDRQIAAEGTRRQEAAERAFEQQAESLSMTQAEAQLAGEDETTRTRKLRLIQLELDLTRQLGPLYAAEVQSLVKAAEAEDKLRLHIEQVEASMGDLRQTGEDIVDTVFNPDNWTSWGDLGKQVLHEIELEFLKLAAINPLKNLISGGNLPTLASAFAGIFAGGFNSSSMDATIAGNQAFVDANSGPIGFFAHASGTEYAPGGWSWVGEFGKELVRLPRGSKVMNAPASNRMAANDAGIGAISIPISIDATGADPAGLQRVQNELAQLRAELPARIVQTYYDAVSRNVIR